MRALALGGQRATAMAQYESCVRILEEELGIEPEAATRDLYAQIRRGELGSPLSPESAPLAQGPTDQARTPWTKLLCQIGRSSRDSVRLVPYCHNLGLPHSVSKKMAQGADCSQEANAVP